MTDIKCKFDWLKKLNTIQKISRIFFFLDFRFPQSHFSNWMMKEIFLVIDVYIIQVLNVIIHFSIPFKKKRGNPSKLFFRIRNHYWNILKIRWKFWGKKWFDNEIKFALEVSNWTGLLEETNIPCYLQDLQEEKKPFTWSEPFCLNFSTSWTNLSPFSFHFIRLILAPCDVNVIIPINSRFIFTFLSRLPYCLSVWNAKHDYFL